MANDFFYKLGTWGLKRAGINISQINSSNYQYLVNQPAWLSLSNPHQLRAAVAENPVLNGCIDILARAASNGVKYLTDLKGNEVPWDSNKQAVKQARKLFIESPNPFQSPFEFNYERYYMFYTFGNNYVYLNNPLETYKTDLLTVQTMVNLPSEYVEIKQTGKYYDQVDLKGLIEKYIVTNENPPREFSDVNKIIQFNDVNTSDYGRGLIGVSRLVALKWPITNLQLAFEAMNVILESRGMQGIIKANNKDATGTRIPLQPDEKKAIDDTFKSEYGIGKNQKQFLITYADVDFIKTILNPVEMGIYKEMTNNSMIVSNNLGVPFELYKTISEGTTFENQQQSVRRMYQNTIQPTVKNEDQYWTNRLCFRNYGLELHTDWSHIEALQESFDLKATALFKNVSSAEKSYAQNLITVNQYRDLMELPALPNGDVFKFEWDKQFKQENITEPIV